MIQVNQKKQVFIHEQVIDVDDSKVAISMSRYPQSLLITINATGTIGSIYQGGVESSVEENIYKIDLLFGGGDNEFYELLFRRILDLIYKPEITTNIIQSVMLFISLPLKSKIFNDKNYYAAIVKDIQNNLSSVV